MKKTAIAAACLAGLSLTAAAAAQTGPALMLIPWESDRYVEVKTDAFIFDDGHTDNAGPDEFDLNIFDVRGRANPDPQRDILRFGFDMTYMDIDSNDPMIPSRLVDQSVAIGFGIGRTDDWEFGAVVGGGYAGDNPYGDSDALYGMASFIASYKIDDSQSIQFFLGYNGNRGIFPDLPLPAVAYNHRVSDTLWYTVGIPYSSITWLPVETVTVNVNYGVPLSLSASIDWEFIESLHLFGAVVSRFEAFHLDGDDENRRLFFSQKRVELGIRWEACENAELILAGGYAFDQEFERGFDVRDLDTVREVSDEPFLRAGVELSF